MTKETKKKLTIEERLGLCFKERFNEFIKSGDITDEQALTMAAIHASTFTQHLKNKLSKADEEQIDLIVKDLGEKVSYFTQLIISVVKKSDLSIDLFIDRLSARNKDRPLFQEMLKLIPLMDAPPPSTSSRPTGAIVTVKEPDKFIYPVDKLNSVVWSFAEEIAAGKSFARNIRTSPANSKQLASVKYSIDFEALEQSPDINITKRLTRYDKRVYTAVSNLKLAGNDYMSASQIYKEAFNKGRPQQSNIKKINDSMSKMTGAHIFVDNSDEIKTDKGIAKFIYDGSLLPFARVSATINGKLTEAAYHILEEPPLMMFARQRNQISKIDRALLYTGLSQTETQLSIEDYLIQRIAHMKNTKTKAQRKILFSTLFERCGIVTRKQQQRAPEQIYKTLDVYKEKGHIKRYTKDPDGITICI